MSVEELAGVLALKAIEQLCSRSIGFVLEPQQHARPHGLEGILPRTPIASRLRLRSMSRAHLPVVPRGGEALQELVELWVAIRNNVEHLSGGEPGELVLHGPDLVEEPKRVERRRDSAEPFLHSLRHGVRLQESSAGRLGRVVALADASPDALFLRQLERRLEEVHEQTRCCVEP